MWIPFDCKDIKPDGSCKYFLAYDLPAFNNNQEALNFLANHPQLEARPLQWKEFSYKEIQADERLRPFLKQDVRAAIARFAARSVH